MHRTVVMRGRVRGSVVMRHSVRVCVVMRGRVSRPVIMRRGVRRPVVMGDARSVGDRIRRMIARAIRVGCRRHRRVAPVYLCVECAILSGISRVSNLRGRRAIAAAAYAERSAGVGRAVMPPCPPL